MIVDHLRLIREVAYRNRLRKRLRALAEQPKLSMIDVLHEADGACCRTQPWPLTSAHLLGPVIADVAGADAGNVVATMAEHEPAIVVACSASEGS